MPGENDNANENVEQETATTETEVKTEEVKTTDDKPVDEKPIEAEGAPENYEDFTMPEGMELDEAALGVAAPVFKELGLDQGKAQKLIDAYSSIIQQAGATAAEAQAAAIKEQDEAWTKELKEEFGDKYAEAENDFNAALERFGDPELNKFLDESGMRLYPGFVRMMAKVGRLVSEPGFENGNTPPKANGHTRPENVLYGNSGA